MNKIVRTSVLAALCGWLVVSAAGAAEYEVQMLAKDAHGRFAQFEPAFLQVEPGDTVTFIASEAMDNAQSIPQLIPEGTENWTGELGANVTVTFDTEGLYVYKCLHHVGRGMIGLIQVGDVAQELDQDVVSALPEKAQSRLEVLLSEAGANN